MTEYQLRLIIATIAFITGVAVGYLIWHKSKDSKTLTVLQIVSVVMFFGYLALTAWSRIHYSDLVAVSILALTGGEPIGKALAKFADKESKK